MTSVADLQDAVSRVEESYEFMISFAGQGIGREIEKSSANQVREYVDQLATALADAVTAARAINEEYDVAGATYYERVLDDLEAEVDEAQGFLALLSAQDRITSQQVDNLNGMSVFQSVVMKLFFLDDLTAHLDRE